MIQEAFAALVPKICGSEPMIGTTSVCASETTMPVAARTATIRPERICVFGGVGMLSVFVGTCVYYTRYAGYTKPVRDDVMSADPIKVIEYEAMLFERHLSSMPGRTRRSGGVLDQSAYTLLNLLRSGGPQSIGELSAVTGLDASTLNRQTAALVRDGLAERISDPDGGMARKFRGTADGDRVLSEERAASREVLRGLLADWPDGDREAFADLLTRFNRSVEERSGREWPRPAAPDQLGA